MSGRVVFDQHAIHLAIKRIAHEILERNRSSVEVGIIGIHTRGVPLAHRLAREIEAIQPGKNIPVGELDISFHRDDINRAIRVPKSTNVNFDIEGRVIILVDDVLYTGRSIRAALNALIDLGRTAGIQLAVLADRGHRQLPIQPDYVGVEIPTELSEKVLVHFTETDSADEVIIQGENS